MLIFFASYAPGMVSWPEAVQRIDSGTPYDLDLQARSRFDFRRGAPVVIIGNSGTGKTEIWSQLTGSAATHRMSLTTDDGYMIRRNQHAHPLMTIPGQYSKQRDDAMSFMFGERAFLAGVIFVASFGYDFIWNYTEQVASELDPYRIEQLRQRNMKRELSNFDEVCTQISRKRVLAPSESWPKWLLLIANKADLYWDEREDARNYYRLGGDSDFALRARRFQAEMGVGSPHAMEYRLLPLATRPVSFSFHSADGALDAPTKLSDAQCKASLRCLVDTLGELWHE